MFCWVSKCPDLHLDIAPLNALERYLLWRIFPKAVWFGVSFIQICILEVEVGVWSWKAFLKAESIELWGLPPHVLLNRHDNIHLRELAGARTKLDRWVGLLSKAMNSLLREASLSPLRNCVARQCSYTISNEWVDSVPPDSILWGENYWASCHCSVMQLAD